MVPVGGGLIFNFRTTHSQEELLVLGHFVVFKYLIVLEFSNFGYFIEFCFLYIICCWYSLAVCQAQVLAGSTSIILIYLFIFSVCIYR